MTTPVPGSQAWLDQVEEAILEPDLPIIDPHHHLWKTRFGRNYLLPDFWADTQSGHNIVKSVFIECGAFYFREGPDHLRPAGETAFIVDQCRESKNEPDKTQVAGIVAHADLTLAGSAEAKLTELLDLHARQCDGRLRGIRHHAARDRRPEDLQIPGHAQPYLFGNEGFRKGLRLLAERGLTYDTWHFHHQNIDFLELARAVPECTMVLDHFGTPLGVGVYRGARDEIFNEWKKEIAAIAKCENVYAKLGGLAMPDNGFGWDKAERPPTSDEFVAAQEKYYLHTLDCFGPERCMFESNFPVDRLSISYPVLWNGLKKIARRYNGAEKHALFYGTAEKIYRLHD